MSGGDATVDLTTTSEHTLDAWMREDGLRVDRVLLITDTNYIPTGLGPAESPFQTITETIPGGLGTTSIAYSYDPLYRLTDATYTGAIMATFAYDYDPVGNMTAFTETVDTQTTSVTRSFDAANRLQTSTDPSAGTTSYVYDDNGNLTTIYPPGSDAQNPVGALSYTYDQRNLMVNHETNPDGAAWVLQAEYVYDGGNDRLRQVDHTGATPITTTYSNDVFGLTQVLVVDDGTTQVYNLFGLGLISQDSSGEVRTLLADGLGSVRLEMVGAVVETATTYSPYGEVLEQTGASGTVYGFTGEQEDSATGLLYLRARYYSPQLKVFQSPDPWEGTGWRPGTLNYYVYVQGNPVNSVDPSGHIGELEKLYIRLLYRLYIRNTAQRLNLPSLTNLSDDGFSSMIAAKMLMEDATVYADTQPDGLIREISTWPVTFLRDWVRERVEELPPFSGEISWGPANIPLELATQNFEWWQRNYECLGFDFDDVHTLYYETQEWNLLTEFFLGSAKSWLALELQTGEVGSRRFNRSRDTSIIESGTRLLGEQRIITRAFSLYHCVRCNPLQGIGCSALRGERVDC